MSKVACRFLPFAMQTALSSCGGSGSSVGALSVFWGQYCSSEQGQKQQQQQRAFSTGTVPLGAAVKFPPQKLQQQKPISVAQNSNFPPGNSNSMPIPVAVGDIWKQQQQKQDQTPADPFINNGGSAEGFDINGGNGGVSSDLLELIEEQWPTNAVEDFCLWQRFCSENVTVYSAVDRSTGKTAALLTAARFQPQKSSGKTKKNPVVTLSLDYVRSEQLQLQTLAELERRLMERAIGEAKRSGASVITSSSGNYDTSLWTQQMSAGLKPASWAIAGREFILNAYAKIAPLTNHQNATAKVSIRPWNDVPLEKIAKFDASVMKGIDRRRLLEAIFQRTQSLTLVAMSGQKGAGGRVSGLCHVREAPGRRLSVGPFYAEDPAIAKSLLHASLRRFDLSLFRSVLFRTTTENAEQSNKLLDEFSVLLCENSNLFEASPSVSFYRVPLVSGEIEFDHGKVFSMAGNVALI